MLHSIYKGNNQMTLKLKALFGIFLFTSFLACGNEKSKTLTSEKSSPKSKQPVAQEEKLNDSVTQKISEDLYLGKTTNKNGETLFLGFERVDDSNRDFWTNYFDQTDKIATTLSKVYWSKKQGRDMSSYDYETTDNPTMGRYNAITN
jgi:hypothetical protein